MPYDILLLNIARSVHTKIDRRFGNYLGINLLAALLNNRGYAARVYINDTSNIEAFLEQQFSQNAIRLVGLYCDNHNVSTVSSVSQHIKQISTCPVVVGGPQAFVLGKSFLLSSGCDVVVRGEAEVSLLNVVEYFLGAKGELPDINGITFLDDKADIVRTPDQQRLENLDLLPFPQAEHSLHDNFPQAQYGILTSRGCPFSCAFCYDGQQSRSVRYRSVGHVMREVDYVLRTRPGLRYIAFFDSTFTVDHKRVESFCKEINKRRRDHDFVWYCEGHIQTLEKHPELIPTMVDAGLARLQIGIESGSQNVLDAYQKKITPEMILRSAEQFVQHQVPQVTGNIILGGAFETEETINESMDIVHRLLNIGKGFFDIHTAFLRPYPGTPIARQPQLYDIVVMDPTGATSLGYDFPVVETKALSRAQIFLLREEADNGIIELMNRLIPSVPFSTIRKQFELYYKYQIESKWFRILSGHDHIYRFFSFLVNHQSTHSDSIGKKEILSHRPLRTFDINKHAYEGNRLTIFGKQLSHIETELLLRCAGSLTVQEIIDQLSQVFGDRVETSPSEFSAFKEYVLSLFADARDEQVSSLVLRTLLVFEKCYLIAFRKY